MIGTATETETSRRIVTETGTETAIAIISLASDRRPDPAGPLRTKEAPLADAWMGVRDGNPAQLNVDRPCAVSDAGGRHGRLARLVQGISPRANCEGVGAWRPRPDTSPSLLRERRATTGSQGTVTLRWQQRPEASGIA